jgi:hypothetical protein
MIHDVIFSLTSYRCTTNSKAYMSQDPLSTACTLVIVSDEGEGGNQIRIKGGVNPGKENARPSICFFSKIASTTSALPFRHSTPDYATRATQLTQVNEVLVYVARRGSTPSRIRGARERSDGVIQENVRTRYAEEPRWCQVREGVTWMSVANENAQTRGLGSAVSQPRCAARAVDANQTNSRSHNHNPLSAPMSWFILTDTPLPNSAHSCL